MKFAGGLLSLSPYCRLAPYESPYLVDGGNEPIYDSGGSTVIYSEPHPPVPWSKVVYTPPTIPPIEEAVGDFFGLPYVDVEVDTTNNSDSPTPIRGPDSPFAIFADLAQGALGGGGAVRQPQAPTLVPVPTSGGGINAGALLIVLALIGGAAWWFFFRKKKGASDAS